LWSVILRDACEDDDCDKNYGQKNDSKHGSFLALRDFVVGVTGLLPTALLNSPLLANCRLLAL
jgi:hypothetical protein